MSKKSWHLDRRTFKRLGCHMYAPYFEAMSMTNFSKLSEPEATKRLCFLYFPNGVGLPQKIASIIMIGAGFQLEKAKIINSQNLFLI